MKNLLAVVALASALPAAAQGQRATEERPRAGLGISVSPYADAAGNLPTVEIYAPLLVAPSLRIEPSLGIFTRNAPTGGTDYRDVTLGVGVFMLQRVGPAVEGYVGGRLKLNFAAVDTGAADDSGVDFYLAAAAGGEWFPASRFSFGLEAQLGLYALDDASPSGKASGVVTAGLAFLRLYL